MRNFRQRGADPTLRNPHDGNRTLLEVAPNNKKLLLALIHPAEKAIRRLLINAETLKIILSGGGVRIPNNERLVITRQLPNSAATKTNAITDLAKYIEDELIYCKTHLEQPQVYSMFDHELCLSLIQNLGKVLLAKRLRTSSAFVVALSQSGRYKIVVQEILPTIREIRELLARLDTVWTNEMQLTCELQVTEDATDTSVATDALIATSAAVEMGLFASSSRSNTPPPVPLRPSHAVPLPPPPIPPSPSSQES